MLNDERPATAAFSSSLFFFFSLSLLSAPFRHLLAAALITLRHVSLDSDFLGFSEKYDWTNFDTLIEVRGFALLLSHVGVMCM